ncbi:hypothetical protein [Pedobacter sp. Hv1]|uniref:hypothetical protein n=1 Tax=Pedobacter sp. Hv1 TaxID=1740090 RepID=UPI0006D8AE3F|nr:hypothetical protein [Pedobacter sp. Hv1]KQC01962.1 hypothetical protein AQF98_06255 [Pedobacter sp. Hv1]
MKKLFLIVMACYALNARSQENESRNFLYLYSDSTIYAQKVRLRPDVMGSWTLRADSRRVSTQKVKFFNNEDGFYANTRKLNFLGEVSFAERIIDGKINLYQEVTYNPIPYEIDYYRFSDRRRQAVDTRMFYNKGLSDLKKVSYKNLSKDMADNQESLDLLKSYRKSRTTGTIMYVAAGASIIASAITLLSGSGLKQNGFTPYGHMPNYETTNDTGSFVLMGLGAGLGLGGYLIQSSGSRKIERAVEAYNRR